MLALRNYTIRFRLYVLAVLAVVAMLVIGGNGLWSLFRAKVQFQHYVGNDVETLSQLADVRAGIGNLRRYEKDLLINLVDAKAVEKYRGEWEETFGKVNKGLDKIEHLDIAPAVKKMPAEMRQSLASYRTGF